METETTTTTTTTTNVMTRCQRWHNMPATAAIDVLCMLPTGRCSVLRQVPVTMPLAQIKQRLWKECESGCGLQSMKSCVFTVVAQRGGCEELVDEYMSLFDIKPARPYLKVTQKKGDQVAKIMKSKINMLIGRSVDLFLKNKEVRAFRDKCLQYCHVNAKMRANANWIARAIFTYPPEFDDTPPTNLLVEKLNDLQQQIEIEVSIKDREFHKLSVHKDTLPRTVIQRLLEESDGLQKEKADQYILKVHGRMSFLFGHIVQDKKFGETHQESPIINYKHIRECVSWERPIRLVAYPKVRMEVEKNDRVPSTTGDGCSTPVIERTQSTCKEVELWKMTELEKFSITVSGAEEVHPAKIWKEVQCGIFHGGEEVCKAQVSRTLQRSTSPAWNEVFAFDLPLTNLPHMARLCLAIVGYKQKDRKKPVPISWVNVPIFDYHGYLCNGVMVARCWPHEVDAKQYFKPTASMVNTGCENSASIILKFPDYSPHPVRFPSSNQITYTCHPGDNALTHSPPKRAAKQHRMTLEEVIYRDPLLPMYDHEKELMWHYRMDCCDEYPESLAKLLQCVDWTNRLHVTQLYQLLNKWDFSQMKFEVGMDLLDYKFPDSRVRSLAVTKILDRMTDMELEMYLLQLIQALKYESYLDSPLAKFLLHRALNNRRIGHYLFWYLKAEVGTPEYSLQFGLMLELYCRGSKQHIDILSKQVDAIGKMKTVSELLKQLTKDEKEKRRKMMLDMFSEDNYQRCFSQLTSPLDPTVRLKRLKVEKCQIKESKKRPLWLVFENEDNGADDVVIIFKNGDDLRQDMLTVLALRIMDNVWKREGHDYGITPYKCLSTGPEVGLIEAVGESVTFARIHEDQGTVFDPIKEDTLSNWMNEQCTEDQHIDQRKLSTFISNFTRSVVGYSVATYVLGVGDRHNDNIMIKKKTGQMFHIDFGHFLGNFKTKFGIKREKVKFVLSSDMLHVTKKVAELDRLKEMCVEAFTGLRSRGHLLITIFAMQLSAGLPELNSPEDLEYLRSSLALDKEEADAEKHFEKYFKEAYDNRSSTRRLWALHCLRKKVN